MVKDYIIVWHFILVLTAVFSRGESDPDALPNAEALRINQIIMNRGSGGPPPPPPPAGSLGGSCASSSDCTVADTVCANSKCICDADYLKDGAGCIEIKHLDDACEKTLQCPENAECNTNCVCKSGYIMIVSECLPELNLGDDCLYNLQCSSQTVNSECDDGTPRQCACAGELVAAADGSCVPATIGLRLEQGFDDAYHANMATPGTSEYEAVKTKLLSVYTNIPDYVSLTELTMEDNAGNTLTKFLLHVTNPDVAALRTRREASLMGGRREGVVSRVRRYAVMNSEMRGYSGSDIVVKIQRAALHQFCISDLDCAVEGSTCTRSACSCTFGSVADVNGGAICKRASFY